MGGCQGVRRVIKQALCSFMVCVTCGSFAQEPLKPLHNASDAGQKVFERRIGTNGGAVERTRILPDSMVEVLPHYPGGADSLWAALIAGGDTSLISDGADCIRSERFTVRFIVNTDGTATHTQVIGLVNCPVLEASMRKAVRQLQHFIPGRQNGSPVRVRMDVPMRFIREGGP